MNEEEKRDQELLTAFVQGAKWWEFHRTGATMWQSDQNVALHEAIKKSKRGTLGKEPTSFLNEGQE